MKRSRIEPLVLLRGSMYLLALSLLVFLRRQFGERVAGDLCVACGLSWANVWCYSTLRAYILPGLPEPVLVSFVLYALTALTAYHLASMWLRREKPAETHTYATGAPFRVWQRLSVSDAALRRYVQPCACALVAAGISRIDSVLAIWLVAASLAVFVEEQLARVQMRKRVLDMIDGRIDSQSLQTGVREKLTGTTSADAQTPVIEVAGASRRKTGKLSDIMARLDPELRQMIDPSNAPERKEPQ